MALHLSEATHQRLQLRQKPEVDDEELQRTYDEFQRNMHNFEWNAQVRACVVGPSATHGQPRVWTSEHDKGTISLRNVRGEVQKTIERKHKECYVHVLLCHDRYLWAGLSDGYIRVFDQKTHEMRAEKKQHCGPVESLMGVGSHVFSGGHDWQIYIWDPKEFYCVGQLSGHQNTVNCMAHEGDMIFSGGEDQTIRAWFWDPKERQGDERTDVWPKIGHSGGVRAITINEVFLFSASTDGTMKVWNTQTGDLVKQLNDGRQVGAQILCLQEDPAAQRIWAGGTDGIISIWDAKQLTLVARLDAHADTYVKGLLMCVRLSSMKVWGVNDDGKVKVWYSDTDEDADWNRDLPPRQDLQDSLETLRAKVIENYRELEKRKQEVKLIEAIDARRKANLAVARGLSSQLDLRRVYYAKILQYEKKKKEAANRKNIGEILLANNANGLRSTYYKKLAAYSAARKDEKRKQKMCRLITCNTESYRKKLCFRRIQEFTRLQQAAQKRKQAAAMVMRSTNNGVRQIYFRRWFLYFKKRKTSARRKKYCEILMMNMDKGRLALYWNRLTQIIALEKQRWKKRSLADALQRTTEEGLRRVYYRKWLDFAARRRRQQARKDAMQYLMRNTTTGRYQNAFSKWSRFANGQKWQGLHGEMKSKKDHNDEVTRVLEMKDEKDPAMIDQEMQDLQDEIDRIQNEINEENRKHRDVDLESSKMKRSMMQTMIDIDYEQSEDKQVAEVIQYLKAKAVHCGVDFDHLASTRRHCEVPDHNKGSRDVFADGMKIVRKQVWLEAQRTERERAEAEGRPQTEREQLKTQTFLPEGGSSGGGVEWVIAGEIEKWKKPHLAKSASAIRDMVIAFDTMVHFGSATSTPSKREFIMNSSTMLAIISQVFRQRKLDEQLQEGAGRGIYGRKSRSKSGAGSPDGRASHRTAAAGVPLPGGGGRDSSRGGSRGGSRKSSGRGQGATTAGKDTAGQMTKSMAHDAGLKDGEASYPPPRGGSSKGSRGSRGQRDLDDGDLAEASTSKKRLERLQDKVSRDRSRDGGGGDDDAPVDLGLSDTRERGAPSGTKGSSGKRSASKRSGGSKRAGASDAAGTKGSRKKSGTKRAGAGALAASEKPWLGCNILMEDPKTGQQPNRVVLEDFVEGGPAHEADLRVDDCVTQFGDDPVTDINSFKQAFRRHARVNEAVEVKFLRTEDDDDGNPEEYEYSAQLVIKSFVDKERLLAEQQGREDPYARPMLGIEMDRFQGNKVMGVRRGGPADRMGLREGDRLMQVNDQNIKNTEDMKGLEDGLRGLVGGQGHVPMQILRADGTMDTMECSVADALEMSRLDLYNKAHPESAGVVSPKRKEKSAGSRSAPDVGDA